MASETNNRRVVTDEDRTPADLKAEAPGPDHGGASAKKETDLRMHSAEHLLTAALMRMLGCGRPFTTHLEKKKSKADYHFARELTEEETKRIEAAVNDVIARDLPVWEEFLTRSDAAQVYELGRLPDAAGERIRIVHIGDYDAAPCIGNHVKQTKEIGVFRIVSTSFQDGALRVRFKLAQSEA